MRRLFVLFLAPAVILFIPAPQAATPAFVETFDGAPASPQPWHGAGWGIFVHSRDYAQPQPITAHHGADCAPHPETHPVMDAAAMVFQCNNHLMTAISDDSYGVIYLTPPALIDFSEGVATFRVDVTTLRTSPRDWWDIWITPPADARQFPLQDWLPDDAGAPPRRAITARLDTFNGKSIMRVTRFSEFQEVDLGACWWCTIEEPTSATVRETFELQISQTHLKAWMPGRNLVWLDADLATPLDWSQGVIQIGHHSYNPRKCDDGSACGNTPNTWHWDNVSISPFVSAVAPPTATMPLATSTPTVTPAPTATALPSATSTRAPATVTRTPAPPTSTARATNTPTRTPTAQASSTALPVVTLTSSPILFSCPSGQTYRISGATAQTFRAWCVEP